MAKAIAVTYLGYVVGSALLPGTKINITAPLGHAGVVMVARDGSTHYFEYGRYEGAGPNGLTRNLGPFGAPTPSVTRDASDKITLDSMKNLLGVLSEKGGKGGPALALVIDATTDEDRDMEAYLEGRLQQSTEPYSFSKNGGHNCGTLICDALRAAGRSAPSDNSNLPPFAVFSRLTGSLFFTYFPRMASRPPVACVETRDSATGTKIKTCE